MCRDESRAGKFGGLADVRVAPGAAASGAHPCGGNFLAGCCTAADVCRVYCCSKWGASMWRRFRTRPSMASWCPRRPSGCRFAAAPTLKTNAAHGATHALRFWPAACITWFPNAASQTLFETEFKGRQVDPFGLLPQGNFYNINVSQLHRPALSGYFQQVPLSPHGLCVHRAHGQLRLQPHSCCLRGLLHDCSSCSPSSFRWSSGAVARRQALCASSRLRFATCFGRHRRSSAM